MKKKMIFTLLLGVLVLLSWPLSSGAAISTVIDGDLIKIKGSPAVYYYQAGRRNVFPSEAVYFSWYSDFSAVKEIDPGEMAAIRLGTNVTVRPGTNLVKITTDPKVYAVTGSRALNHIASEAQAVALYGESWADRVVDIPDSFWHDYALAAFPLEPNVHPQGSLIRYQGSTDIYYIDASAKKRKFKSQEAFMANNFQLKYIIDVPNTFLYEAGEEIAGLEKQLSWDDGFVCCSLR